MHNRYIIWCVIALFALVGAACAPQPTATPIPTATTVPPTVAATEAATAVPTQAAAATEALVASTPAATQAPTTVPPTVAPTVATAAATAAAVVPTTVPPTVAPAATAAAVPATAAPTEAAVAQGGVQIGLVTDVGQIDDRSFNQSAYEGAQAAAKDLGGTVKYIVTQDPADYANNIAQFADKGYKIIVTVGFALGDATLKAAAKYPDINFIGVDQFQGAVVKNVTGLVFHEENSGFLAGVLAASLTKSGTIAAVLGTDQVPPVVAYKEGYEAGAKYVKPDIKVISTYYPGGLDKAFTDPVWGAQTAGQAIDQGADVIFGAGGKTGNGALGEVAKRTTADKPLFCIGVDDDQWLTVPEGHACLVSSAMKLIKPGVAMLIAQAAAGKAQGGNSFGDADIAPFHDFDKIVPADVVTKLNQVKADLKSGKIVALPAKAAAPAATAAATAAAVVPPTVAPAATAAAVPATAAPTEAAVAQGGVQIGLVTDVGQIDDRSFNQSAYEGAQAAAKDLGGTVKYIVTQDPADYANNIAQFADKSYKIIVTVGFALGDATLKAAAKYPDINFIGVDQFQGAVVKNVTGLVFHEENSGFLAGVLAASLTKSGTIAAVLGTDQVPPVVAYKEGYEAGAKYVKPDIKVISTYYPGGLDKAFTDPVWGAQTAGQAIDQGADVIFGAGGKTGNGALGEVAKRTTADKPLFCIGVDDDQWLTVPEAHACLVSSAMKLIKPGVAMLIAQAAAGKAQGGNSFGDADIAPFHDFDKIVPADVVTKLNQVKADLKSGKIVALPAKAAAPAATEAATAAAPAMAPAATAAAMDAVTAAATPAPTAAASTGASSGSLVVGYVLVGPKGDKGWSEAQYDGALYVEKKVPGVTSDVVEALDPNITLEQIVNDMKKQGVKLIFTTSDAFQVDTLAVAKKMPDLTFVNTSGDDVLKGTAPSNLGNVMGRMEYTKMLGGCAAALATNTKSIGYVGPLINDETRRLVSSAYLGAKYCYQTYRKGDPKDLKFEVKWIGYWFNQPGKTLDPTEVTNSFFTGGADVVMSGIDTTEAIVVAKQRADKGEKVFAVPYDYKDACTLGPTVCLGVPYFNWGPAYAKIVADFKAGTWKQSWDWNGPDWKDINNPDTSNVGFAFGSALTADQKTNLDSFISDMGSGKVNLFTGPLNFQSGKVYLKAGEVATDQQIWYFPELLEGMTGQSQSQ